MNSKYSLVILLLIFVVGSIQFAHAGGSGSEESETQFINDNYYKVKLETNPSVLEGDENEINFDVTTINDDTQEIISGIEYEIQVFDGKDNLIVDFVAYSPDDKLKTVIIPSQSLNISGEKTENNAWLASNESPLFIESSLFLEGGLVNVKITVLSIDSTPVSESVTPFEIMFTMGEFIPFTLEIDDKEVDLMFATYFDKIEKFEYDAKNKKVIAEMPFDWNKDFIKSIPFVHAEYYIPKTVDIFNNHEILLTINDETFFGTIDRSGNEEIVVHFLLSSSKLLKLLDQIPSDQHDKMIFGIESGKQRENENTDASLEDGEKAILLSTKEDWKFHLSLTPKGKINPGNEISLNIEFHDPVTNSLIPQILYDLDIFLNGKIVESEKGLETPDGRDSIRVTFDDLGAVIVRISNVNNFDTSGEFSFKVSELKEITTDYFVDIASGSSLQGCENSDSCYIPSLLDIDPNQVILWNNRDSSAHTVTSGSPEVGNSGSFDSGIIAAGEKFFYKFEKQGIFDYYCTLHPWMIGTISVGEIQSSVPEWIKNNAGWWADGAIDDGAFIQGIQFLIKEGIIQIPNTTKNSE
ncbi:MAG: cupredoxin domain-containing protein, partial [Candidatus Nitrosopumilus sp. bin_32a]